MPRMLVCYAHKTVDILPDYDTANDMEGKYDYALQEKIKDHFAKYGDDPARHPSKIMRIEEDEFELLDPRKLQQAALDGSLEEYIKDQRENYKEDALKCYNLHDRPVVGFPGCRDYRSDSRAIGITKGIADEDKMYVCDFCPYQSYVDFHKRKAAGLYGR